MAAPTIPTGPYPYVISYPLAEQPNQVASVSVEAENIPAAKRAARALIPAGAPIVGIRNARVVKS